MLIKYNYIFYFWYKLREMVVNEKLRVLCKSILNEIVNINIFFI